MLNYLEVKKACYTIAKNNSKMKSSFSRLNKGQTPVSAGNNKESRAKGFMSQGDLFISNLEAQVLRSQWMSAALVR